MPNSLVCEDPSVKVIVGVDTHKHEHVAVAINGLGARLATGRAAANQAGYAELLSWARQLGAIEAFGIEGTGSYGVVAAVDAAHRIRRGSSHRPDGPADERRPKRAVRSARRPASAARVSSRRRSRVASASRGTPLTWSRPSWRAAAV